MFLSAKFKYLRFAAVVALAALSNIRSVAAATSDLNVYTDNSLSSGWENWSWSTDLNFAATDIISGASGSSISVRSDAWAAFSLKLEGTFPDYAGMKFDIAVGPSLSLAWDS